MCKALARHSANVIFTCSQFDTTRYWSNADLMLGHRLRSMQGCAWPHGNVERDATFVSGPEYDPPFLQRDKCQAARIIDREGGSVLWLGPTDDELCQISLVICRHKTHARQTWDYPSELVQRLRRWHKTTFSFASRQFPPQGGWKSILL